MALVRTKFVSVTFTLAAIAVVYELVEKPCRYALVSFASTAPTIVGPWYPNARHVPSFVVRNHIPSM